MKKPSLFILFILIIQHAFSQSKDANQIKKLNQQWMGCYATKDTATLNKIFADDLILISPSGKKMTKKDIISNVAKQDPLDVKIDSADVRMFSENVGAITAYISGSSKNNPQTIIAKTCYLDIYVKRKGIWVVVAAHVTSLK